MGKRFAILMVCLTAAIAGMSFLGFQAPTGFVSTASAAAKKVDFKHLINRAGRQRTLTQKMSKEFLLVALGYSTRENLRNLRYSREAFSRVLKGLRYGDADLELQYVEDSNLSAKLSQVESLWPTFESAVAAISAKGEIGSESVQAVAELRMPLLTAMDAVVDAYEEVSNKRRKTFSLADHLINEAGWQRTLIQQMSTEYLLIVYGHQPRQNRKRLAATIAAFESRHTALMEGDEDLRVVPAPTPRIRSQLLEVERLWLDFKPQLQALLAGNQISQDDLSDMASMNMTLLGEMEQAVHLYEAR